MRCVHATGRLPQEEPPYGCLYPGAWAAACRSDTYREGSSAPVDHVPARSSAPVGYGVEEKSLGPSGPDEVRKYLRGVGMDIV